MRSLQALTLSALTATACAPDKSQEELYMECVQDDCTDVAEAMEDVLDARLTECEKAIDATWFACQEDCGTDSTDSEVALCLSECETDHRDDKAILWQQVGEWNTAMNAADAICDYSCEERFMDGPPVTWSGYDAYIADAHANVQCPVYVY